MTDRPILFSAPMVRALLAGTKTQTRRTMKEPYGMMEICNGEWKPIPTKMFPRDRLWVRETWSGPYHMTGIPPRDWLHSHPIWYWADGSPEHGDWTKPKPGIHMPRWASRLTLTVTDVRVERLQDISEADARAEGIVKVGRFFGLADADWDAASTESSVDSYAALWESINGPGAWEANPWVAAYTFIVHHSNIDQMAKEAA